MTATAIAALSTDEDGFFLMVEGSQIDWGGHLNHAPYIAQEMVDLDRAIGVALQFAAERDDTIVVVTADHETGGLSLESGAFTAGPFKADFTTIKHTATMVPVFAYGAGASVFGGIYENTEIHDRLAMLMGL